MLKKLEQQRAEEQKEEEYKNKGFLQGRDLSKTTENGRPPVPKNLDDRKDFIEFMQIDIDTYTEKPEHANRMEGKLE